MIVSQGVGQRAHLILVFKLTYVRRHHYTPASKLMYESFVSAGLPLYLRYPALFFVYSQEFHFGNQLSSTPETVGLQAMRDPFCLLESVSNQ